MTNLRNNDFEQYKRKHPDVKEIATVWRGSDEDQAWRDIYLTQEEDIVQFIENEQVVTFFRALTEKEKATKEEAVAEAEKPASRFFENLGVIHEHANDEQKHTVTFVKLATPRLHKVNDRWAEIEYVLIDQFSEHNQVADRDFWFTETAILPSDAEQTDYTGGDYKSNPIYSAPGWLEPWQALWVLGEIATLDDKE